MARPLNTNEDVMDREGGKGGDPNGSEYIKALRTVNNVTIPREVFEKLYGTGQASAQPKAVVRSIFGNPMPIALLGSLTALSPLGCTLMGWRGAGGEGAALIGVFYFFGGMLQVLGGTMEWIIGNTFPAVVFLSYAFFFLTWVIINLFYMIAALRTNIMFVIIFFCLMMAFSMLASADWVLAEGNKALASDLTIAAGAFIFAYCAVGWYVWLSLVLTSLDFPFTLPLGDLSKRVKMKDQDKGEA